MAALGNIGITLIRGGSYFMRAYSALAIAVQPTGNGPIVPAAPFLAAPFSTINLNDEGGAQQDRVAITPSTGIWEFFEVPPGIYYASEVGVSKQWKVEVFDDLSWLVTPVTSSFPVNASSISIG